MRNDENVVPLFVDKIFQKILDGILTTDYADLHG